MSNVQFYNIKDQTQYSITVSKPEKVEDLSDWFVSREELEALTGTRGYLHVTSKDHKIRLDNVVREAILNLGEKLIKSKKKTLPIDDEDLLDVLKSGYLTDMAGGDTRFGRHGDRICFARRYNRKKTKATKGDVKLLWNTFSYAFRQKYDCYPSHIPTYDRTLVHFKAWQKIIGWRRIEEATHKKEQRKFFRQIWDNPEEYV